MDDRSINEIVTEIAPLLLGRGPGKIFQLGAASLAIDFGLRHRGYLLISVEPSEPRLYLIKRRVRDLEKQSLPLTPFALSLRKELANTQLTSLEKDRHDRIVHFNLAGRDDLGTPKRRTLVAQLTGRSANLFVLAESNTIVQRARQTSIAGQRLGEEYQKPFVKPEATRPKPDSELLKQIRSGQFSTPSEAADAYFTSLHLEKAHAAQLAAARTELRKKIAQQQKLLKQLERDLSSHADFEEAKRFGDLLLANLSTAKRHGNRVKLIDYFADDASLIEIEIEESTSLQEEAARRFERYSRSKRAVAQITRRIEEARRKLLALESELESERRPVGVADGLSAEPSASAGNISSSAQRTFSSSPALQRWDPSPSLSSQPASAGERKEPKRIPGTRCYLSTDGFEILVGRTACDNDRLTFKVAKPNDLWLHAADYGGSHVVVRNSTRKPIPHRTLIEAAQLAAWFSQAKKDLKVDVHHTERKFVSKIKGGKPGLVRLQRFKNITVEPKEAGTRV